MPEKNSDIKMPIINDKTIKNIKINPRFYTESPVRVQIGKIYKTGEFEQKSNETISSFLSNNKKRHVLQKIKVRKR